jgi:hypothetical protein
VNLRRAKAGHDEDEAFAAQGISLGDAVRILFALASVIALFAPLPAFAQRAPEPSQKITISAQAIEAFDPRDNSRFQFGPLMFRGGLVLTSPHREFGGLSSLRVMPDGARFLAVTDKGNWLRARIVYRGRQPIAIADAEMAPILGADGRPLNRRGWYDSEALADDGTGTLFVGFERVHQIARFNYARDGLQARAQPIPQPPGFKSLSSNRSIECLAIPQKGLPLAGNLIAVSERGLDAAGNILGWLIGLGSASSVGTFAVKRTDEFDISDCTVAPSGDLLLLERRFSWMRGIAMRIRRVPLANVRPGAVLDGPELIFADMGYQIDNMEGISLHRAANGALVMTLISDDNFSPLQRTVLLQFEWAE